MAKVIIIYYYFFFFESIAYSKIPYILFQKPHTIMVIDYRMMLWIHSTVIISQFAVSTFTGKKIVTNSTLTNKNTISCRSKLSQTPSLLLINILSFQVNNHKVIAFDLYY